MAIKRITNIEAYDMSNEKLIEEALDLAYKVGEVVSDRDCFDYAASMSHLLTEIKWRAIMRKFEIKSTKVEEFDSSKFEANSSETEA